MVININKLYDFAKFPNCFFINHINGQAASEDDEVSFTISVHNKCLKSWYDLKKKSPDVSFVQIINCFLAERYVVLLAENCARVESHVRKLVTITNTKMSTERGRAYTLCANSVKRIAIRSGDIQRIGEIKEEFGNLSSENEMLQEQNRCIAVYCEDLADSLTNVKVERSQAEEKFEK